MNELLAAARLEVTAIYGYPSDCLDLNAIKAADIDGSGLSPIGHAAQPKWLATTNRAKLVLDHMTIERVCGEFVGA